MSLFEQKRSLHAFWLGIALLVVGMTMLLFVNSRADNIWGYMSPPLIVGGLVAFGFSLYYEDSAVKKDD